MIHLQQENQQTKPKFIESELESEALGSVAARVHCALRKAVVSGRVPPGRRLPPSRARAEQLSVRRNVVVGAY